MIRHLLFSLSLLFVSSCIFDTRTPDNPGEQSANYKPPTEASDVFVNMANAFTDKNAFNYKKSFSDSAASGRAFVFEPASQAPQGVFQGWTRESEAQYFSNITVQLQPFAVPSLQFSFTTQSVSPDTAFFEGSYLLMVPHTRTQIPQIAMGRAQFYLVKDNIQNWMIWRWVDFADQQGGFSWSDVKGEFGQ